MGNNDLLHDVDAVLEVIGELVRKSAGRSYIYRGERRPYQKVSSSLYRRYEDINTDAFDIEVVQREILDQARDYTRYTGEVDDIDILSQLQHNGGETNLIDFTTDFLIALFFACDGEPEEPGRVVLLSETGEDYTVLEPSNPVHRVLAQKSLFVRPAKGFVEPDEIVTIASNHKPAVLEYLREHHGISTETIYNDLHGFIRHQGIHRSAYTEFHKGLSLDVERKYQQAIEHYTAAIALNPQQAQAYNNRGAAYYNIDNYHDALADFQAALELNAEHSGAHNNLGIIYAFQRDYLRATQYYDRAIDLDPESAGSYANRGEAWLHLSEWDKARADLATALSMGRDIIASFRNDYENVADFEQRNGITIPDDIAAMLGG